MPKNNFYIQNDVKLNILHEKKINRTILTLYVKLPEKYDITLKNKVTIPDIKVPDYNTKAIREIYKEIEQKYPNKDVQKNEKNKFLANVKGKYNKDWRKVPYETVFNFCVIPSHDESVHCEYLHYQLPGVDHSVGVNINACIDDDIPKAVLENLKVKYTEKFN